MNEKIEVKYWLLVIPQPDEKELKKIKKKKDKKIKDKSDASREIKPITDDGARRLAAAIIESAALDYRMAGIKLKHLKYKMKNGLIKKSQSYRYEVERYESNMMTNKKFIMVSPIVILMNMDPNWIIETLDEQIKNHNPAKPFKKGEL